MSDHFMPIDLRQINTGQAGAEARRTNKSSSNAESAENPNSVTINAQPDSVELSDKAQLVQSLISDMSSRSEINESRVEQVRTSIASGEFSVSADKIANNILALEVGLRKLT